MNVNQIRVEMANASTAKAVSDANVYPVLVWEPTDCPV